MNRGTSKLHGFPFERAPGSRATSAQTGVRYLIGVSPTKLTVCGGIQRNISPQKKNVKRSNFKFKRKEKAYSYTRA